MSQLTPCFLSSMICQLRKHNLPLAPLPHVLLLALSSKILAQCAHRQALTETRVSASSRRNTGNRGECWGKHTRYLHAASLIPNYHLSSNGLAKSGTSHFDGKLCSKIQASFLGETLEQDGWMKRLKVSCISCESSYHTTYQFNPINPPSRVPAIHFSTNFILAACTSKVFACSTSLLTFHNPSPTQSRI